MGHQIWGARHLPAIQMEMAIAVLCLKVCLQYSNTLTSLFPSKYGSSRISTSRILLFVSWSRPTFAFFLFIMHYKKKKTFLCVLCAIGSWRRFKFSLLCLADNRLKDQAWDDHFRVLFYASFAHHCKRRVKVSGQTNEDTKMIMGMKRWWAEVFLTFICIIS